MEEAKLFVETIETTSEALSEAVESIVTKTLTVVEARYAAVTVDTPLNWVATAPSIAVKMVSANARAR